MSMDASLLVNAIIAGLLLGGFYAAVTVGVSISFGMLDVVNIAHPAFIILGSYIAYILNTTFGLDPILVKRIAFGISIGTAGLAGACLIIIQPIEPSVGREYIGRVFAICVLGGMGSLPGTLIAAMLLGIVESFTATFYGPSWAPAVAFGFLLLTLAVRPAGILGR